MLAAGASAATGPPPSHLKALAGWTERLSHARQALSDGKWQAAKEASAAVIEQMTKKLVRPEGAGPVLASASLLRGLAEAGLGETRAANWDYAVARALDPSVATADPAGFGRAAGAIGELAAAWSASETEIEASGEALEEAARAGTLHEPRSIGVLQPAMPFAKLEVCVDESVDVQFIVGADGALKHPTASPEEDAVLVFAVMESIRRWSYQPARIGEKAVMMEQSAGVRVRLDTCER